jgi:hypothetical protein
MTAARERMKGASRSVPSSSQGWRDSLMGMVSPTAATATKYRSNVCP